MWVHFHLQLIYHALSCNAYIMQCCYLHPMSLIGLWERVLCNCLLPQWQHLQQLVTTPITMTPPEISMSTVVTTPRVSIDMTPRLHTRAVGTVVPPSTTNTDTPVSSRSMSQRRLDMGTLGMIVCVCTRVCMRLYMYMCVCVCICVLYSFLFYNSIGGTSGFTS